LIQICTSERFSASSSMRMTVVRLTPIFSATSFWVRPWL